MVKTILSIILSFSFFTSLAQFPNPYCAEAFSNSVEPITLVNFAHINQSSTNTIGGTAHENYTAVRGYVVPGNTYTITVKGNTGGSFTNYFRLFVDWNNDNDFLDVDESYNIGTITNSTGIDALQVSANILISAGATVGNKRMRVIKRFGGYPVTCNTTGYGQAEDYTLNVFSVAPYCTNEYPSAIEPITRFSMANITNNTSNVINGTAPHEDFTSTGVGRIYVAYNQTYTVTLRGNTNGNNTDYFSVFIDWNDDGDYLDAGETYNIGSITNSTGVDAIEVSNTITISTYIPNANRRLRVAKQRGSYPTPCSITGFGQSEEYTLYISYGLNCTPEFPNDVEPISLVNFTHINNATSNIINATPPYESFTIPGPGNAYVYPGGIYPISVKGNTGGNFTDYITAYINWNSNSTLNDAGEVYNIGTITNSTGLDATIATNTINVPTGLAVGSRLMRIIKLYNGYPTDPCNIGGWGQAEDYIVNVYDMAPYCNQMYPDNIEPITSVNFTQFTITSSATVNATPPNEDFTSINFGYVRPNSTYTVKVKGNTDGNYTDYIRAFVDWNNDNDFLDANESYDIGTITNSTGLDAIEAVGTITVPAGVTIGQKRMRITKRWNAYATSCSNTGYGQSEDYRITVYDMAPYCNTDFPAVIEPITLVNFGGINNTTIATINATPPHEDFTATYLSAIVSPGQAVPLTVKGNTNGANTNYISAFIDWNNDNDFLDAGENYNVGTITSSTGGDAITASIIINIPANASIGYHRMRVVKGTTSYPTPCQISAAGQSEDYLIKIINSDIKAIVVDNNAFLQGDYVEVGINQCGSWGTTRNAPFGYHARSGVNANRGNLLNLGFVADPQKNGWETGTPNKYNGDYFMPFEPFVGWGVTFNGSTYGNDRTTSTALECDSLTSSTGVFAGNNISAQNLTTKRVGIWQGTQNGLQMTKTTTVKQDKVYFTVSIKLKNTTASAISGIYYGEYVNPDNDAYQADILTGIYQTINSIIYQNPTNSKSLVQAIGWGAVNQRAYMALGSKDCRSRVFRGSNGTAPISNWYNGVSPYILAGTGSVGNESIGISFNIGTLAAGDSTTFTYTYILKQDDFNDALVETDPTFTYQATETPNGGTITPCANSTNTITLNDADGYTWTWSPATGLSTTTGKVVDMTVTTTPITYTVTGVSASGCSNKTITLNVEPVDISTVSTTPISITKCISDNASLLTALGGTFTNATVFAESFNGTGNNWNKFNNSTGGTIDSAAWILRQNGYTYAPLSLTFNSNDNSQFYLSNSHAQTSGSVTATILQSPAFSTLGFINADLTFYHYFHEPTTSASSATVQISTDGTSWTNIVTFNSTQGSTNNFSYALVPIPVSYLNQPTVYIRFKYDASSIRYVWAIDNVKLTAMGQPITWSPLSSLFNDAAATIPYTGQVNASVYANPLVTTLYTATSSLGACSKSATTNVVVTPLANTLGGTVGTTVCQNKIVDVTGSVFNTTDCKPLAKVEPNGGNPVSGTINTCVYINPTVLPTYNAEPYLPRHFDITPATNPASSTGRITLYVTDAEFVQYNANNGLWPDLPTVGGGGNTDPNRANLRVTQYHGTPNTNPSSPNQYSASTRAYINPNDADIIWNGNYWEISFDVTGFSGFYIHTNLQYTLPVTINYLNGKKQNSNHLLDWKVTCNSSPKVTMVLERSGDNRVFNIINSIEALAAECNGKIFNYTDANPLAGINYYRLKIIDANGEISFSNTIALINATKGLDIVNVAPNPINGDGSFKLNITSAKIEIAEAVIMDMQGRIVERKNLNLQSGFNSFNINVPKLAAGTYTISVVSSNGDKSKTIRFVKQ